MRKPIPVANGKQITAIQPIDVKKWESEKLITPIEEPLDDDWFESHHDDPDPITFELVQEVSHDTYNFLVVGKDPLTTVKMEFGGMKLESSAYTYALAKVEDA